MFILMKAARTVHNDIVSSNGFNFSADMLILMNAARIVRNYIASCNGFNLNASFPQVCQKELLLMTLKLLVTTLIRGSDIVDQDSSDSQACLSVAQMILLLQEKGYCYSQ